MKPADLSAIHAEAFEQPWGEEAFESLLQSDGVGLWGDDRGFILIRAVADEAEILTIAVRPSQRRQGLARQLVENAVIGATSLGARQMFLEVAQSNVPAISLYTACGFEQVGVRKNYYKRADGQSEHALVMVLNFSQ